MFRDKGVFSDVVCPNNKKCSRPHCPYQHKSLTPPPTNVPIPKPLVLASTSSRKPPSYAPQTSPAVPKVTVDYKELLRGCKNYKSPGKRSKTNNLFDKFGKSNSSSKKVSNQFITDNDQHSKPHRSSPEKRQMTDHKVNKQSLFEKIHSSFNTTTQKSTSKPSGRFSPTSEDKSDSEEYEPEYNNNSKPDRNLVYKPGIGVTDAGSVNSGAEAKNTPPIVYQPLAFYDPYSTNVREVTSPSQSQQDLTLQSTDDDEQESPNASLVIADATQISLIESDDEKLLSDEDERLLSDEEPDIPDETEKEDLNHSSNSDILEIPFQSTESPEAKSPEAESPEAKSPKAKSPEAEHSPEVVLIENFEIIEDKSPSKKIWLADVPSNKQLNTSRDNEVFGSHERSPIKFKKTFQKKKPIVEDVIEINDEEDAIMEVEYGKDLEYQKMKMLESLNKSDDESCGSKSMLNTSQTISDSDINGNSKKSRKEQKLEEIKQLKARIFEKQWNLSKKGASSSESSSGSNSESGHSGSSTSSDSEDSDFSIDSDASVKSDDSEQPDTNTSSSDKDDDFETQPKRKRKRLSSPIHDKQESKSAKPVLALTPQQIIINEKKARKERRAEEIRKLASEPSWYKNKYTIQIMESPKTCKLKRPEKPSTSKHESEKRLKKKHRLKSGIRSDQIIPHQKKLAEKKQKSLESKSKKLSKKEKYIDNLKSFYQNKNEKEEPNAFLSKYKKADLSHFDPPTPPPDEDPHRWGNLSRSNRGKRVAHKPSKTKKLDVPVKSAFTEHVRIVHKDGPRLDLNERSHVPVSSRQQRLDYMITEYLKIWPDDREKCFDESLKAEKSCLHRSKTKQLYTNLITNEIKRIRELKSKLSSKDNRLDKTSVTVTGGNATKLKFYEASSKYKISKEEMKKNHYPGYYEYRPEVLDGLHCVRCSKLFQLEDDGEYTTPDRCLHHSGKLRTVKSRGFKGEMDKSRIYDCCQGTDGSSGCSVAKGHVFNVNFLNRDWRTYVKTKRRDSTPSVWGLDCEMCYTAGGVELTRVTVVDMYGKTALDMLVKPPRKILDYNTKYSGIKESDLQNVENSLEDAQREVSRLITWDCFIVGHSLESDLHALKLIHKNVIDTSVVFYEGNFKKSLAVLSADFLGRIIQSGEHGHDSTEDAVAALDLVKQKLKQTDNFRL